MTIARYNALFLGAAVNAAAILAARAHDTSVCLIRISVITSAIGAWSTTIVGLAADILRPRPSGR